MVTLHWDFRWHGSPELRRESIQIGNPFPLVTLGAVLAGRDTEDAAHILFSHRRHRGEWFRISSGLLAYIGWLKCRST